MKSTSNFNHPNMYLDWNMLVYNANCFKKINRSENINIQPIHFSFTKMGLDTPNFKIIIAIS